MANANDAARTRLIEALARGESQVEAGREAGFHASHVRRLLQRPELVAAVARRRLEINGQPVPPTGDGVEDALAASIKSATEDDEARVLSAIAALAHVRELHVREPARDTIGLEDAALELLSSGYTRRGGKLGAQAATRLDEHLAWMDERDRERAARGLDTDTTSPPGAVVEDLGDGPSRLG